MQPRRTIPTVIYNKVNIHDILNEYLESFSYIDEANGASDTIDITLSNIDKRWLNEWFPIKGDKIIAYINKKNWTKEGDNSQFLCGSFMVDDFEFRGRPLTCSIKGISSPKSEGFTSTKRSKVWEKATIKSIADEISARNSLKCVFDADDITIQTLEQNEQEDSTFLKNLCDKYGLAMKIYSDKIIIYDIAKYDKKEAVVTIDESDMIEWSFQSTLTGTYTGGKMQYTDAKTGEDYIVTVGTGTRLLEVNGKADSRKDALKQITSKVNTSNRGESTMSITMMASDSIVASSNVKIIGLGKASGKYSVEKVTHDVGSNYTIKLELKSIGGAMIDSAKFSISKSGKNK